VKKFLIVGETGEIASDLYRYLGENNLVYRTSRQRSENRYYLDLESNDLSHIADFPEVDAVVFASGIAGNDACLKNSKKSQLVNVKNTIQAIDYLSAITRQIYFISTSLCFGRDLHTTDFSNLYLRQKLEVEQKILDLYPSTFLLRPSKVIGLKNKRIKDWFDKISIGEVLEVPSNVYHAPVSTLMLSQVIERHSEQPDLRIVHLSSSELISLSEFVELLIKISKLDGRINRTQFGHPNIGDSMSFLETSQRNLQELGFQQENIEDILRGYLLNLD
jgi:dTDP-4-dehydrorhamnose reductase